VNIDLLGSIELTASAAIMIAAWLGRHLCRSDGFAGRLARLSADHKCTGDCKDLEHHRNRGSDRRGRIGSNVFARFCALNFRRTKSSAIMATLPWLLIPGFLVPLLFAVHIGILIRLVKAKNLVFAPNPTATR
jgi:hypothetical protein